MIQSRDELKSLEVTRNPNNSSMYFIGDLRDNSRLTKSMCCIYYVVHAVALQQVTAAEYNPVECIKTNVHIAENSSRTQTQSIPTAPLPASNKSFMTANYITIIHYNPTSFVITHYGDMVSYSCSIAPLFQRRWASAKILYPPSIRKMTRAYITLHQGIYFMLNNSDRMKVEEFLFQNCHWSVSRILPVLRRQTCHIRSSIFIPRKISPNNVPKWGPLLRVRVRRLLRDWSDHQLQ
ncbi:polysaccharide biosynthesis protein [Aeromonas dhakensis]|nr:polysaccharide biosynthesis protein [Aeromonas dhakensis]UCM55489.1 polysaccharide biosynthesis protein [Aeromonas dhakensis]